MDEPPPFPSFAFMRTRQASTPVQQPPPPPQAMSAPYMFPFFFPHAYPNGSDFAYNNFVLSPSSSKQKLPASSLSAFLKNLDQQYGEGEYTGFEKRFLDEKITVSVIKHLTDAQLIELGVEQIGSRTVLKVEADKYI